jgi:hypothetical protein
MWNTFRIKENFMRKISRLSSLVLGGVAASMLAACSSYGPTAPVYPSVSSPSYPAASYPVAGMEYGRIVNIEYMPVGTSAPSSPSILGAVVGGVAGAVLGNQIARNQQGVTTTPGYRITMQTDQGVIRTYEVPATGDLRVGDRVRVDNGVIYRG